MLAAKTVAEIQRLLDLKTHSQRRIAAIVGVSRGSVAAIASGKRRDVPADAADDAPMNHPVRRHGVPAAGGLVYMPCVFCAACGKSGLCAACAPAQRVAGIVAFGPSAGTPRRYEEARRRRKTLGVSQVAAVDASSDCHNCRVDFSPPHWRTKVRPAFGDTFSRTNR